MRKTLIMAAAAAALAIAGNAHAEAGDYLVKGRVTYDRAIGTSSVAVNLGTSTATAKTKAEIGGEIALGFFLTDHIATEVSLNISRYELADATGASVMTSGRIRPALLVQYYPMLTGRVRPYLGAGAVYDNAYTVEPGILFKLQTPTTTAMSVSGALGAVGQLGVDVEVNDKLYVNIDAKYLRTARHLDITRTNSTPTQTSSLQSVKLPAGGLVIGAGIGFKF